MTTRISTAAVVALALFATPALGAGKRKPPPAKPAPAKPAPAKPAPAAPAPAPAALSGKEELAKAEKAFEEFNYGEAEKALVRALAAPDNDRPTVLRIYELRGIIDATTGKKTALDHFRRLVAIDPERSLSRDLGPRILQPFYEAKARLDESPPIKVAVVAVPTEGKQTLSVAVQNDSLQMASTLKFFYRPRGGTWESRTDPAKPEPYELGVNADVVEYYAQLFSPNNALLIELGSEAAPLVAEPKTSTQQVVVVKEVETSRPMSTTRKLSIGVMAVGVATIGGAIAAGAVSSTARNEIENPQRDEQGRPIGMTPEKLAELQSRTTGAAIASNVMWVAGGVLAGLGLVLFIADPGGGAKVAVVPSAGGVMAAGQF